MFSLFQRKTPLVVTTTLIFISGVVAGIWRYHQTEQQVLASLVVDAQRCAIAFDRADLESLTGTAADRTSPAYQRAKDRLTRLARIEPEARIVELLRVSDDGRSLRLLVDSETVSRDPARQIDLRSGKLKALVAKGVPCAEEPAKKLDHPEAIAFAPVNRSASGISTEILALHQRADQWYRTLWEAAVGTAAYVWMFLVLPFTALVTTRRHLKQREALRNLTEAMEQGQSAVMIVNLDLRIEYANAGLCRQIGYDRRELIGREWREFQDASVPADLMTDLLRSVREGRPWSSEWMMRRKDASSFPVRGAVTPIKDRGGEIRSFVAVFEDMTEIRRTENVLREAKDRAEAGDRAKGQFLATMSHEVRTPLNGIVGFASLLLETELTPEQQEFVETIRTSSETLIQLTGDILDYARIESGRLKLEPQPCDARECVENALDLAAAAAVAKNIELLHWTDDNVPAAIVADVSRLRQVIVNLVNNAVKFTMNGEVEVRVRMIEQPVSPEAEPTSCTLEFSVRDTGIGIAQEHHGKIFRPFSQVDESTTRRFGGTGLGLAICKNIVDLMGGTISFVSEPGRGSTFTFTVRVAIHISEDVELGRRKTPLIGRRLVVVAASAGLQSELARLGTRLGATVIEAPPRALPDEREWDLAVVDVGGPEAMELAMTPAPRPQLPPEKMIALVPIVLPAELRAALRSHFRSVLNKPLHHEMLASLLSTSSAARPHAAGETRIGTLKLHVMIVEDNPVNQQLVQKIIANLGCRWTAVPNGRAAVEQLARTAPDVVLMDLHMPELDGLSAITKIRAGDAGAEMRDVWIIALTADARGEQRARTLAAGANDYLTKPVHVPALEAALARFAASRTH